MAAGIGSSSNPRLLYLALLFGICSSPALVVRKANDRYAMYTIFCGVYFMSFGMIDVISLTSSSVGVGEPSIGLNAAELLIVAGGIAFATGYQLCTWRRRISNFAIGDWSRPMLLWGGLILWVAGTYATWYWNIHLTVRAGEFNNDTGEGITTLLMLGRYVQPLGLLVLAYAYTMRRSVSISIIVTVLAAFQVYLGFVSDTKGGAMIGGIMVIVTGYLVKGKVPKAWAVAGLLFIFLAFPIFQAHRLIVVGERGLSNANSVDNLARVLDLSVNGQDRARTEHAESFFERSSVKSAVEMIVTKTGDSVPYQHGYTLLPLAAAFIPRLLWPDKIDVQTGQLVNKEFHVTGESVTYISPSHLGELYWNFGWIGAICGMLLLGLLLGWINVLCDLSVSVSVTRLLILGITILQLGVRFEASIATEYAVWLRSIAAVLLLHGLFSRKTNAVATGSTTALDAFPGAAMPASTPNRFPNLLR